MKTNGSTAPTQSKDNEGGEFWAYSYCPKGEIGLRGQ